MRFADRMSRIRASAIRDLFDRGLRVEGTIDLSIGQADFDVPEPIKRATIAGIEGPDVGLYSPTEGYPETVDAVRAYLHGKYGLPDSDSLMLTAGATGALTLATLALAGPGDEILMPDPCFVMYPNLARIAGATPTFYRLRHDFSLDLDEVEQTLSDRTRFVLVNSPANPTGCLRSRSELAALAELCGSRGVPVVSDELYELFVYDGEHVSIKEVGGCDSLLVGGLSKAYGMAGWRLGWAAGPAELIERMRVLQQFVYTCAPTLVQRGAVAAFGLDMSAQVERYRAKRDLVYNGLVDAGYHVAKARGSFFMFPRVPWGDDLSFVQAAVERKLLVVPGRAFSNSTDHFRICFGAATETLEKGLEVLVELARKR